jgi:hypothetical protein
MIRSKSGYDYVHLERYNLVLSTACGAVVKVCYSLSGQIGLASQNDNGNTSTRTAVRQSMQTMPATTECIVPTGQWGLEEAPCITPTASPLQPATWTARIEFIAERHLERLYRRNVSLALAVQHCWNPDVYGRTSVSVAVDGRAGSSDDNLNCATFICCGYRYLPACRNRTANHELHVTGPLLKQTAGCTTTSTHRLVRHVHCKLPKTRIATGGALPPSQSAITQKAEMLN